MISEIRNKLVWVVHIHAPFMLDVVDRIKAKWKSDFRDKNTKEAASINHVGRNYNFRDYAWGKVPSKILKLLWNFEAFLWDFFSGTDPEIVMSVSIGISVIIHLQPHEIIRLWFSEVFYRLSAPTTGWGCWQPEKTSLTSNNPSTWLKDVT